MKLIRIPSALLLVSTACRFGGPSGNPSAYTALADDGGDAQASGDDGAGTDAELVDVSAGGPVFEASTDSPAGDGEVDDGGEGGNARDAADGGTCAPPMTVPVCNPVTNLGCTLLQCDVDTTMSTPTGVCVLGPGLPAAENAACTQTSGSTPCAADLSCFGSTCRRVCFCDSDCIGECCNTAYGTTGFKVCGTCP